MDSARTARQLDLIEASLAVAQRLGVEIWLRGGWAMDFFLGRPTRDHEDIDWFSWSADASVLSAGLVADGHIPQYGPPLDQQRDFRRNGIDSSFALLSRDESGLVVIAGGPWAGEPWPEVAPDGSYGRIGTLRCAIVNPQAQIQTKQMMPVWVPGRPRRAKDLADIDRLSAALRRLR